MPVLWSVLIQGTILKKNRRRPRASVYAAVSLTIVYESGTIPSELLFSVWNIFQTISGPASRLSRLSGSICYQQPHCTYNLGWKVSIWLHSFVDSSVRSAKRGCRNGVYTVENKMLFSSTIKCRVTYSLPPHPPRGTARWIPPYWKTDRVCLSFPHPVCSQVNPCNFSFWLWCQGYFPALAW